MPAAFKDGDGVRLKVPVIEGRVDDVRFNKDENELEYLVSYRDIEGDDQQRWFPETKLEVANVDPS